MLDTAELNDIEFSPSPTGFVLNAALSSYWSILMIAFLIVWTGGFALVFSKNWSEMQPVLQIGGVASVAFTGGIFWWIALLRVFGTQHIILDTPNLEVGVGLGPLRFRYHFDTRHISSIAEGEGTISGGENTPPYRAIVLEFTQPIPRRIFNKQKFAFGHYLTKEQKRYVINRLHEAIRTAT